MSLLSLLLSPTFQPGTVVLVRRPFPIGLTAAVSFAGGEALKGRFACPSTRHFSPVLVVLRPDRLLTPYWRRITFGGSLVEAFAVSAVIREPGGHRDQMAIVNKSLAPSANSAVDREDHQLVRRRMRPGHTI